MDWHKLCTEEEQALREEIIPFVDHTVLKNTYSSINEEMKRLLMEVNDGKMPEHVFVLGFDTECCVLATATDLFEMGIRPIVLTEYCGSHDGPRYHDAGIISMEHLIGPAFLFNGEIMSSDDVNAAVESCWP